MQVHWNDEKNEESREGGQEDEQEGPHPPSEAREEDRPDEPRPEIPVEPPEPVQVREGEDVRRVRCMVNRYTRLNERVGEERRESWEQGKHVWILRQDGEVVTPTGFMPEIQIVPLEGGPRGYCIQCAACGLWHRTARYKAVRQHRCAYSSIALGRTLEEIFRIPLNRRVHRQFSRILERLNSEPERRQNHWPQVEEVAGGCYNLRCTKCGSSVGHHKKKSFLRATCGNQRVLATLCGPQNEGPRPVLVEAPQNEEAHRAGSTARIATLNIGSLNGKEGTLSTHTLIIIEVAFHLEKNRGEPSPRFFTPIFLSGGPGGPLKKLGWSKITPVDCGLANSWGGA